MSTRYLWRRGLALGLAGGLLLCGACFQQKGTTHTPGTGAPTKSAEKDKTPEKDKAAGQPKPDPG